MAMNTDLMFYMVVLLVILTVIILIISIVIASKVDTCTGGKRFVGAKKSQIMETDLVNYRDVDVQTHQQSSRPSAYNYSYSNTSNNSNNSLSKPATQRATVNDYIQRMPGLKGIGEKIAKPDTSETKLEPQTIETLKPTTVVLPQPEPMDTSESTKSTKTETDSSSDQVDEVKRLHKIIDKIDDSVQRLESDISLNSTATTISSNVTSNKNISKNNPNRSSPVLTKRSVTPVSHQKMVTFAATTNDTTSTTNPTETTKSTGGVSSSDKSFEKIKINIKN